MPSFSPTIALVATAASSVPLAFAGTRCVVRAGAGGGYRCRSACRGGRGACRSCHRAGTQTLRPEEPSGALACFGPRSPSPTGARTRLSVWSRRGEPGPSRPKTISRLACLRKGLPGARGRGARLGPESDGLDLDLDVYPGWQVEPLEGVDGLRSVLDDVDQPLVDPHLEVLAAVLVLVRRADHRVPVLLGRKGHRAEDLGLRAPHGLDDLLGRLVEDLVVVGLEPNPDLLAGAVGGHRGPLLRCGRWVVRSGC